MLNVTCKYQKQLHELRCNYINCWICDFDQLFLPRDAN